MASRRWDAAEQRAALLCLAYALVTFTCYLVWKACLAERSADPAIIENCLWNAVHGHGLRSSLEGGLNHLAIHFSPALYALVPLYALSPSMAPVHAIVCVGTALAGFVLWREARARLGAGTATMFTVAFLLHPTIVLQTFMEFHEQALAVLPLVLLLVMALHGRARAAFVCALALLTVREDNALLVLSLALYVGVSRREWKLAGALGGLALAWIALYRAVGLGLFGGGQAPPVFAHTYHAWGATPTAALRGILTHPGQVAHALLSRPVLAYLAPLLGPLLGLLPLGAGIALVGLPQLALVLLADPAGRLLQVRMHYSVAPVTVAYVAGMVTLARMAGARAGRGARWATGLTAAMMVVSLATVPIWCERAVGRLNPYRADARAAMAVVPATASVTAPGYMLDALSTRRGLDFTWGTHLVPTEYVILEEASRKFFAGESVELDFTAARGDSLRRLGLVSVYDHDGEHIFRRPGFDAGG